MDEVNDTFLPLTQSQLLLWTGYKMNPDVPLHHLTYTFDILGTLDENAFKTAFQELLRSADILRMVFHERDGVPYQSVLPDLEFHLEVIDFTSQTDDTKIQDWIFERTEEPFNLSKRVFDTVVLKLDPSRYIWVLKIHHLVTDAISNSLLYRRMNLLYQRILTGNSEPIEEMPPFTNYLHFEREQLNLPENENYRSYWKEKTARPIEKPRLYGEKIIGATTTAERVTLKMGRERSLQLQELIKRPEIRSWTKDLSLFNVFLTLYFIYLYRVSGQKNLTIGVPSHNRIRKDFQKTPGFFIEVFPLYLEIGEGDTFNSILQKIKLETNSYLQNARPGMATPEMARSFNAILNYIHTDFPDFNGFPTETKWVHPGHVDSSHAIQCHIHDMGITGELEISFDLNELAIPNTIAKRVPDHFLNLFDAFIDNIEQPVEKPSLITESEAAELLPSPSLPEQAFTSIIAQFQRHVETTPKAMAIKEKGLTYTYEELNKRANQLAHGLIAKKIDVGNKVALYLERSPEYVIGVLAVLKIGATFIPIPSDQAVDRVTYILEDSGCELVLTSEALKQRLGDKNIEAICLNENHEIFKNQPVAFDNIVSKENDVAYMIYTSGTTGNPKGALITQAGISNYMDWAMETYIIDKATYPLFTSIGFDVTISSLFLPLLSGGELHIYREAGNGPSFSLMDVIEDNQVNSIKVTPSHMVLLQGTDLSDSLLHTIIVGGEDFKTEIATSIPKIFGKQLRIFNEYGPTEATIGCIVSEFKLEEHAGTSSVPIGKPIANMQIYVLDSYQNPVPLGVVGELYLSGIGLGVGYSNLPDLTKEKFLDNPFQKNTKMYRTGDLARLNTNGEFEYLGRIDQQIKLGGYRIELSDIEANLMAHPDVENAAVMLVELKSSPSEDEFAQYMGITGEERPGIDEKRQMLVGYYTASKEIPSSELTDYLSKKLPSYMVPPVYRCLEELPLTSNGKVDRRALQNLKDFQPSSDTPYVAPRNEFEELLEDMWKDVLELEKVGVHDNFITLGGHSLTAIRITTRVNEELEMNFPLNKVFELPTIAEYAQYIEKTLSALLKE